MHAQLLYPGACNTPLHAPLDDSHTRGRTHSVQVAQRWRFQEEPSSLMKLGPTEVLPNARIQDLGAILLQRGYQVGFRGQAVVGRADCLGQD